MRERERGTTFSFPAHFDGEVELLIAITHFLTLLDTLLALLQISTSAVFSVLKENWRPSRKTLKKIASLDDGE